MDHHPDIILVLTDDQGYPALGCNGHPYIQTPNIDAFAEESVRFTDFHSGTTCAPTRAGLFTGRYCNSTGVWHTIGGRSLLRRGERSLADRLRDAGYRTALFGKWHLGDEHPYRPQDRGFDHVVCHGGGGVSQQPDWWGNDYFDDTYSVNGVPTKFNGYCTDVFFGEAIRFIESCASAPSPESATTSDGRSATGSDPSSTAPFFCVIATNAPHSPFNVPAKYRDLYTGHTTSDAYARFLGMCTNIDENFGALRRRLSELGIEDDTILMFMSDNGQTGVGDDKADMYNAGMRGLKGSPYEGGHRIPFFLRWANGGTPEGHDVTTLSAYIDFTPTLLDLAGIGTESTGGTGSPAAAPRMNGRSLAPVVRGEKPDPDLAHRTIVTDTQRIAHPLKWRLSCAMEGRWRLVNRDELYNLELDPGQTTNVAADHPEVVERLRRAYEAWWTTCTEDIDAAVPSLVGHPSTETVTLRTHDLRNDTDQDTVWNQAQVRKGLPTTGWWEVEAATDGEYEFELRRWPVEAGHAIASGIDGDDVEWNRDDVQPNSHGWYTGGVALDYTQATLIVDESTRREADVPPDAPSVALRAPLSAGQHHVRALFSNAAGAYGAAYYVRVRRVR